MHKPMSDNTVKHCILVTLVRLGMESQDVWRVSAPPFQASQHPWPRLLYLWWWRQGPHLEHVSIAAITQARTTLVGVPTRPATADEFDALPRPDEHVTAQPGNMFL